MRAVVAGYQLRYGRRLVLGRDVVILGGLKIQQGTTLHLGDGVRVRRGVLVNGGGEIHVGADTLLNGCWIGATTRVDVGRRCLVSDCFISDSDFHNLDPAERHLPPGPRTRAPIVIEDNAWIGAQAWVLKGSRIGRDSVVSAASVVRGEVPPAVVVVGNPAQVVKQLRPSVPLD
ncbi:acyltransferase [Nocardioides sp. GY 10127]|nr:acyltransferase [Nocardioides sp. GY 10127]